MHGAGIVIETSGVGDQQGRHSELLRQLAHIFISAPHPHWHEHHGRLLRGHLAVRSTIRPHSADDCKGKSTFSHAEQSTLYECSLPWPPLGNRSPQAMMTQRRSL